MLDVRMEPRIRPFVLGQDEETWVDIDNRAWRGDPDMVPLTAAEFRVTEAAPGFSNEGRFIAEVDGAPAGRVLGFVDPLRKGTRGFVYGLDVVPECRRRGIGAALLRKALASLADRGMDEVQADTYEDCVAARGLLARHGFHQIREFSRMARDLAELPRDVGEHRTVELTPLGRKPEDARLLTRLSNEAFREHFGFRDSPAEEEQFWMEHARDVGYRDATVIARIGGEPVGFLVYGHNARENERLGLNRGWIYSLGVLKPHRGRGIAKTMLLYGMARLRESGRAEVVLGVDDSNVTHALSLYERLGFRVARRSFAHLKSLRATSG